MLWEGLALRPYIPSGTPTPTPSPTPTLLGTEGQQFAAATVSTPTVTLPAGTQRALVFVHYSALSTTTITSLTIGAASGAQVVAAYSGSTGPCAVAFLVDVSSLSGAQTLTLTINAVPSGNIGVFLHYLKDYNFNTGSWSFAAGTRTSTPAPTNAITITGNGLLLCGGDVRNTLVANYTLTEASALLTLTQGGAGTTLEQTPATNSLAARTGYVSRPTPGAVSMTLSSFIDRCALASVFIPE